MYFPISALRCDVSDIRHEQAEEKTCTTYVGERPSFTFPLRGPTSPFTEPALLDFLRRVVAVESETAVTATAAPSNILFRL